MNLPQISHGPFFAGPANVARLRDPDPARYSMKAAGKTGEITLYDDIGASWFGGISSEQFAKDLKALGTVDQINVRINSPGGQVFDGLTMYNLLRQHKAKVTTYVDGLAASIASVIAMAGDQIVMADNSMMMIHDAWGVGMGTAEEIRKTADVLDTMTATIADIYTKRSGTKLADIRQMMIDETWLSADEAKAQNLCDSVIDSMNIAAAVIDPSRFKNAPKTLLEQQAKRPVRDRFAAKFQKIETNRIRERLAAR